MLCASEFIWGDGLLLTILVFVSSLFGGIAASFLQSLWSGYFDSLFNFVKCMMLL